MNDLRLCPENFDPKILFSQKTTFTKKNAVEKPHSHKFLCVTYITTGIGEYYINNKHYTAKKDDIVILNPDIEHYKRNYDNATFSAFEVGLDNIQINGLNYNQLLSNDISPIINLKMYKEDFYNTYHEIITTQDKQDIGWRLITKTLIMKLIIIILKESFVQKNGGSNYFTFESYDKNAIVDTIISYLQNNYMNKISVDEIAKNTYLSSTYISKIFKELTGESIINYLIGIRLNKAKEILEEGYFTIQDVSKIVGYSDAFYFSKLFKKRFGCSPSQYKIESNVRKLPVYNECKCRC